MDSTDHEGVTESPNKGLMDEIKRLRDNMKTLVSQMADQNKTVQRLRQEVDNLKKSSDDDQDLNAISHKLDPEITPSSTPVSIDIENFRPPKILTIMGSVPHDAIQFSISLKNSQSNNSMLHINPRFNSGFISDQAALRNDFRIGLGAGWGPEETHGGNPFPAGQYFTLDIQCEPDCYKLSVNKMFWTTFAHRQDFALVNQFCIQGQVNVTEYSLK
uniref:Galectin n=1 Tax=Cacopsylla melanoneura TaxID=428564 RepID=A0A8D9AFI6_9HEMI